MAGSGRIKGKQIVDDSIDLKKLSSGIKLLPNDAKLGINKTPAEITDPKEYVTREYIDSVSEDVDEQTIILDGSTLKVNLKNTPDSDEIGIILDGTNGIHLNKSDISQTIIGGLGLDETVDSDGVKTLDVKALSTPVGSELNVKFGTNGDLVVDIDELSNTFLNKVETSAQTVVSDVYFNGGDITFDSALTTKTKDSFSNDQELVSKGYVDSVAQGLDWKESALLATDQDLTTGAGWTYTIDPTGVTDGSADTLVFATPITSTDIDTGSAIALTVGNRILIKNQADSTQNGIYELTDPNTLTRSSDHDSSELDNVSSGNSIFIEQGTYENTGWVLQGNGTLTLNTDNLDWIQFSGAGQINAGAGLVKTGDKIDVELLTNGGLTFDVAGDAGRLTIDAKTPASTDIGIQLTGGVHILKSDISGTIINGNAINSTVDPDGIKTLDVDANVLAGNGLSSSAGNNLEVNVDDTTIEIDSDILRVKSNGIDNTHLNYGTNGDEINANSIPTLGHGWLGSSVSGESVQEILQTLDSDIQAVGGATTASNGLVKDVSGDIMLGGDLTKDTTISGTSGTFNFTVDGINVLTLSNGNGSGLVLDGTDNIFTDSNTNLEGIKYASDYSATFVDNSLVSKKYVDDEIDKLTTESTTAGNGLTMNGFTTELGGTLDKNTVIDGDSGSNLISFANMASVILDTVNGGSLSIGTTSVFTDNSVAQNGLQYASDYSATFVDNSLVNKKYVDDGLALATTSGNTQWDTLEITGFGVSGTSGQVSYSGTLTFLDDAIDEAQVYVNGLRLDVPTQAYFDTPSNSNPVVGSTLFFDLDQLGYEIETDDCIVITYLIEV